MARTGNFGRQPRVAPSLTNTLVSIAREFQRQRDQNIMDAWQKGGTYEGHQVTDEEVLAHWKQRMSEVSSDDPLYDTYHQAYDQLDYSIHESKMTAAYALHKRSDGEMVKFYLGWAKKVPKNSEFYRQLQRDAGQYMRTVRANGAAAARAAEEAAYQKLQASTRKGKEAAGEFMIDTLRRVAQSGYADGGYAAVIGAPGSGDDLTSFDVNDPNIMLKLLGVITIDHTVTTKTGKPDQTGKPQTGNPDVIYYDDSKKPVTGQDILDQLGKLDPGWKPGTPLDVTYVTGILDKQVQGLDERIARAKKTGHLTDVNSLTKNKEYVATVNREVAAWPVARAYQDARQSYTDVMDDPTSTPQAKLKAWDTYRGSLYKMSQDERIKTDDNLRSRLVAEANGDSGVPTLNESFTGLQGGQYDNASAKESALNIAGIENLQKQADAVKQSAMLDPNDPNKVVWAYGVTQPDGSFAPQAGGTTIGATTVELAKSGGANAQTMTIDDPLGGAPLQVMVTAVPVYATAKLPDGTPVVAANSDPIAWAFDVPKGGKTVTKYGFQTPEGFFFTDPENPPWDPDIKPVGVNKGGQNQLEVDLSGYVGKAVGSMANPDGTYSHTAGLTPGQDLGNGLSVGQNGEIVYNPLIFAQSTDDRKVAGIDPMTDHRSLTVAMLMTDPEGQTILRDIDKRPEFKRQLEDDAYTFAGAQRDAATGRWVLGTGDQTKLAAAMNEQRLAPLAGTIVNGLDAFLSAASKEWDRTHANGAYGPQAQANPTPGSTDQFARDNVWPRPLPTDTLQGTPMEVLGNAFPQGSTVPTKATAPVLQSPDVKPVEIKTGFTLNVPAYVPPKLGQTATGGPSGYMPPPPQQGSTAPGTTQGGSKPPDQRPNASGGYNTWGGGA